MELQTVNKLQSNIQTLLLLVVMINDNNNNNYNIFNIILIHIPKMQLHRMEINKLGVHYRCALHNSFG